MSTSPTTASWEHFARSLLRYDSPDVSLDTSRIHFPAGFLASMADKPQMDKPAIPGPISIAFSEMRELEAGAISNQDEGRQVGHYWLRAKVFPTPGIESQVRGDLAAALDFAADVHAGKTHPPSSARFTDVLLIGIGGSALGPQLAADALEGQTPPGVAEMRMHYFDNTDPDGMERVLRRIGERLKSTLTVVISKSGATEETFNGMMVAKVAYEKLGLDFGRHAVAVTGKGSLLDDFAESQHFLHIFPMQEWVGGRTSLMHTVGLVPMTLQGIDVRKLLEGAGAMDEKTRIWDAAKNMAMQLALAWHAAGEGRGAKDMVILPYKDRLALFSKYLQQLVMESLGKQLDRSGRPVNQGIAVYGNKGSTDQHAYVQQLRDGINNFFATFIEVRCASENDQVVVKGGATPGDYLQGFLRGTRNALTENGRQSITISIPKVNAYYLGALIALYERAVGFYASLVNINAYHQPGVQAGKKAAEAFLKLRRRVRDSLTKTPVTAPQIAGTDDIEETYHVLAHLAATDNAVATKRGATPADDQFWLK